MLHKLYFDIFSDKLALQNKENGETIPLRRKEIKINLCKMALFFKTYYGLLFSLKFYKLN